MIKTDQNKRTKIVLTLLLCRNLTSYFFLNGRILVIDLCQWSVRLLHFLEYRLHNTRIQS